MRKALVPFLVLGLLLLGVSPAMAAGEQAKAALPAQQDEVVQVVVPEGEKLEASLLSETKGGQAQVLIRVVRVAIRVGRAVKDFVERHPFGSGVVVGHYASKYILDPVDQKAAKTWNKVKNTAKRAANAARRAVERANVLVRNALRDPVLRHAVTWW